MGVLCCNRILTLVGYEKHLFDFTEGCKIFLFLLRNRPAASFNSCVLIVLTNKEIKLLTDSRLSYQGQLGRILWFTIE